MKLDANFFPGWVRKCITFTIDDGNLTLDRKFMGYIKPAGIKGTFNLITPLNARFGADGYRELYNGYEIANHCRYHAYPFDDAVNYKLSEDAFDPATADRGYIYKMDEEGFYRVYTYAWCCLADDKRYMECVESCTRELEEVFGKGTIKGYVWPCGAQNNRKIFEQLKQSGFQSIRATGCTKGSTSFALPADRNAWSYNADYTCLNDVAKEYDAYPDDGELKFFCFGVHSHDFENHDKWDELASFCAAFGNRPDDFWYASNGDIFDYEDAVKRIKTDGNVITNPSGIDLYVIADGKKLIVPARGSVTV